nr:MAG TPA: hypothetical protein [Caudoviricetes sp.]
MCQSYLSFEDFRSSHFVFYFYVTTFFQFFYFS